LERYGTISPVAVSREELTSRIADALPFGSAGETTPIDAHAQPIDESKLPEIDRTIYDTARRLWSKLQE
jgi:hypothetical protein